ncbi:MAG TPA: hypothetical protein VGF30_07680, partial [Bacteroidia bacterium]
LINEFAFEEIDKNRAKYNAYNSPAAFEKGFVFSADLMAKFIAYTEKNGIKKDEKGIKRSSTYLANQLKALMGRNLLGNEAYYALLAKSDKMVQKALEALKK